MHMKDSWKVSHTELLLDHPRIQIYEDTVILPTGALSTYLHFGDSGDGATIIVRKDKKFLVQKEYSHPIRAWLHQLPGGGIDKDETPLEGARRELHEEECLDGDFTSIGWCYINNRRTPAKMHIFVADNPTERPGGILDEGEVIERHWMTEKQIDNMIKSGQIVTNGFLSAWMLYKLNLTK